MSRSSHPGAGAGPKGTAVRRFKEVREAGFRTFRETVQVPYLPWV